MEPNNNIYTDEKHARFEAPDHISSQPKRHSKFRRRPPGRCTDCRKRLFHVFHMRKYFLTVIGLAGCEIGLVIMRLVLEIELLRLAPGVQRSNIVQGQLAITCISLFILTLFLVEVPFKIWALGCKMWGRSLLQLFDSLVCTVAFSVNIYNIYRYTNYKNDVAASPEQVELCGTTHITMPRDTAATFATLAGIMVVYRFWHIKGYIQKTVTTSRAPVIAQLAESQRLREAAEYRVDQMTALLREQGQQASLNRPKVKIDQRHSGSTRESKHSRQSSRRTTSTTRGSSNNGEKNSSQTRAHIMV